MNIKKRTIDTIINNKQNEAYEDGKTLNDQIHAMEQGGLITAADSVQLSAQHDVVMDNTVTHLANQDVLNRTAGIAVTGDDGVLLVEAGYTIDLAGVTLLLFYSRLL